MENFDNPVTEIEIKTLRQGIKDKYRQYHLLDRDQFPDFEYNTNRANYKPLRSSFENEFFVVRDVDRTNPVIHIPSTNTLALLFTDDNYIPSKKITNTCHLYAEVEEKADLNTHGVNTNPSINRKSIKINRRFILAGLLLIGLSLTIFAYLTQSSPSASGLIINRPYHKQIVPRIIYVEGKVMNAEAVWIVVRPMIKGGKYYVQSLAKVEKNGTWKESAIIGPSDEGAIGKVFQIRAFVNPAGAYKAIAMQGKYIFDSWPEEAELSTEVVEVIRGPEIKK